MLGFDGLLGGCLLLYVASLSLALTLSKSMPFLPKQLGNVHPSLLFDALSAFLLVDLPYVLCLQSSVFSHQPVDHALVVVLVMRFGVLSAYFSFHLAMNFSSAISTVLAFDASSS